MPAGGLHMDGRFCPYRDDVNIPRDEQGPHLTFAQSSALPEGGYEQTLFVNLLALQVSAQRGRLVYRFSTTAQVPAFLFAVQQVFSLVAG